MKKFKVHLIPVLFFFLSVYCGGTSNKKTTVSKDTFDTTSANNASTAPVSLSGKRALLIGINDYPYVRPTLMGCVNDVMMMRSLLMRKFSFPAEQITILPNEKATRKAILNAFHDLIANTRSKDTVVIFYSGHGSQISNPTETDGLSETIIPYDYRDSQFGALPITDKQIGNMLGELSLKTPNITIILDCCHSGGATRDLLTGTEKEIPKDSRKAPGEDDFLPLTGRSLTSSKLNNPAAKYVLLSGCRSDQKSYETKSADGVYGGMLTVSLVNRLSVTNESLTWPRVVEDLQRYIRQFYNQSPELAGVNKNSYVFGSTYNADEAYFIIQPSDNKFALVDGGSAQDITVGSIYKVYPPGTLHFDKGSIGTIQITKTSNFSSEAKIIEGKITAANCRAVEYKYVARKDEKLFISFLGNWNDTRIDVIKEKILALNGVTEDNKYPNLIYYRKGNEIIVYSGRDTLHALQKIPLGQSRNGEGTISSVMRWNKWFRVANMRNLATKLKASLLFDVTRDISLDTEDINFKSGREISFSIKNNSNLPVYVYVLILGDTNNIDVYTLDAFKTPGQSISEAIPAGGSVSCAMTPSVRSGQSFSRDVMKIIITTVATDFKSLEQKNVEPSERDGLTREITPANKPFENLDDWFTIEKVIFIKL
ncbi:caspase domain-containing protein [Mucilaginibacter angelicae]|uniref:Caspase domain-containing protein n=1 Tax=Mucilaginibacter angelicae TaxID=869718 RepID=A0ABV6L6P7_9SPHI